MTAPRPRRLWLKLKVSPREALLDRPVRPITVEDAPALARLLLAAYKGTVDDEGETPEGALEEATRLLDGTHGPMVSHASLAIDGADGLDAACVVTMWKPGDGQPVPLIAVVATDPPVQRRGLGAALIVASVNALADVGAAELHLWVTEGNDRALRLYQRLGFDEAQFASNG